MTLSQNTYIYMDKQDRKNKTKKKMLCELIIKLSFIVLN